jgi:hypothetical protein
MIGSGGSGRVRLVKSIDKTSSKLQEQLQNFLDIAPRYKIISFYELKKTKMLVKVRSVQAPSQKVWTSYLCTLTERFSLESRWRPEHGRWN